MPTATLAAVGSGPKGTPLQAEAAVDAATSATAASERLPALYCLGQGSRDVPYMAAAGQNSTLLCLRCCSQVPGASASSTPTVAASQWRRRRERQQASGGQDAVCGAGAHPRCRARPEHGERQAGCCLRHPAS